MSRERGRALELALAAYLRQWWPAAEAPPPSRPGSDVLGTPGIVWESKTAAKFSPLEFSRQARGHRRVAGDVTVTVYWPPGVGVNRAGGALAIMPLADMVALLLAAGYGDGAP